MLKTSKEVCHSGEVEKSTFNISVGKALPEVKEITTPYPPSLPEAHWMHDGCPLSIKISPCLVFSQLATWQSMWRKASDHPGSHEAGFVVTDFESFLNYSHLGLL